MRFLLKHQRVDGVWPYALYFNSGRYYWQVDYHQGFIIDGVAAFLSYVEDDIRDIAEKSLKKGIKFYLSRQFTPKGISYYRYPLEYPIDIHNQAQGIIMFSKLYRYFKGKVFLIFAEKIASWTIRNMQDPSGYFYAHKWPGFVNRIPYMRWAQAWMMLALSNLLNVKSGDSAESTYDRPY